jgi:hypothetical protein
MEETAGFLAVSVGDELWGLEESCRSVVGVANRSMWITTVLDTAMVLMRQRGAQIGK